MQNAQEKAENWDDSLKNNKDLLVEWGLKGSIDEFIDKLTDEAKEVFGKLLEAFNKK